MSGNDQRAAMRGVLQAVLGFGAPEDCPCHNCTDLRRSIDTFVKHCPVVTPIDSPNLEALETASLRHLRYTVYKAETRAEAQLVQDAQADRLALFTEILRLQGLLGRQLA